MSNNADVSNFSFYRHDPRYPQDQISLLQPTHQFSGTVVDDSKAADGSTRIVDGAVWVKSVDSSTRSAALSHFSSLINQEPQILKNFKSERNYAYLKIGAGVVTGLATAAASALVPIAITIALIAGSTYLVYKGYQQYQQYQHSHRLYQKELHSQHERQSEWKDPISTVIQQRQQAGTSGFEYVYTNKLKGIVVHKEEANQLWKRAFNQLLTSPINPAQIFHNNILGAKRFNYAWNDLSPEDVQVSTRTIAFSHLAKMASVYRSSKAAYRSFSAAINEQIATINLTQKNQASEINAMRQQWMIPAQAVRRLGLEEVEHRYHTAMRNGYWTAGLEVEYHRDRRMCELLYKQSKLCVDQFFDGRLRQLNDATQKAQQQVESERQLGHQHFTRLLAQILNSDNETSLDKIQVAGPIIAKNWQIPNFNTQPVWDLVYSRPASFLFTADCDEVRWNLFWGDNGLRYYARHPIHTWSNLCTQRTHFPLRRQGWFHLRRPTVGVAAIRTGGHVPVGLGHVDAPRGVARPLPGRATVHPSSHVPVGSGHVDTRPHTTSVRQPQPSSGHVPVGSRHVDPMPRTTSMRPQTFFSSGHVPVGLGRVETAPRPGVASRVEHPSAARPTPARPPADEHRRAPVGTR